MATNNIQIPQVGSETASLAESHPASSEVDWLSDSGGAKFTPVNEKPNLLTTGVSQPVADKVATGQTSEEKSSPFIRSRKTPRSPGPGKNIFITLPPLARTQPTAKTLARILGETSPEDFVGGKRKRRVDSEVEVKSSQTIREAENLLTLLNDTAEAIGKLVAENLNTKTEIKRLAHGMQLYCKMLRAERLRAFVQEMTEAQIEKENRDNKEASGDGVSHKAKEAKRQEPKKTKEVGCQADFSSEGKIPMIGRQATTDVENRPRHVIREEVLETTSYADFLEVCDRRWPLDLFS